MAHDSTAHSPNQKRKNAVRRTPEQRAAYYEEKAKAERLKIVEKERAAETRIKIILGAAFLSGTRSGDLGTGAGPTRATHLALISKLLKKHMSDRDWATVCEWWQAKDYPQGGDIT